MENIRVISKMAIGEHARQGDVLLRKINKIPATAKQMKRDPYGRVVLALGEKTGHGHTFRDKGVCSFSLTDENDVEFVQIGGGGATLKHELVSGKKAEHDSIRWPDGNFEQAQQVDYTPTELINQAD